MAAKAGLPDPDMNARLRLAVTNAKAESMPKDVIERAIKKASGGDADDYEEIRYEGFGPGGVGVIVEVLTDNRNRAAANVRTTFSKIRRQPRRDRLGRPSCWTAWARSSTALRPAPRTRSWRRPSRPAPRTSRRRGRPHHLHRLRGPLARWPRRWRPALGAGQVDRHRLAAQGADAASSGDARRTLMKLIDALDDDDDVQNVYANYDISDAELEKLAG